MCRNRECTCDENYKILSPERHLLYKRKSVILVGVEGCDKHEAFLLAHDHVVVLEEEQNVQGRDVVLVVPV